MLIYKYNNKGGIKMLKYVVRNIIKIIKDNNYKIKNYIIKEECKFFIKILKIKYPNVIFEYRYYNDLDIHSINYNCLFLRYDDKFKELSGNFLMKYFKKYKSLNIYIDYDLKMDLNNL